MAIFYDGNKLDFYNASKAGAYHSRKFRARLEG